MNKIFTIIKYELSRYFTSPLAYVYLVSFLLLSGSCAIYFGHFFVDGSASLWSFFDYQPWIYLLFVPGIAMRSWAEEFKTKTITQLMTLPVSVSQIVWGKFFASWIFVITAIILTFPFWITVNVLGNPDNTVIFIGYIGCFIISGAMLAISQTMSSLTKNSVISLVLAVFVNLLFFWSSFEYVLFWARELFSDVVVDTIISFSFLIRFFALSRGLVELRDLVFFGSLIVFFNVLTMFIVSLKTKGTSSLIDSKNYKHGIVYVVLFFVAFFGINIIANNVLRQINYDFTVEKHLSLTKNTKNILKNLKRPVIARLYYSPILEKRNPNIRQVFDKVKFMLKQYKSYAKGMFDYKIYNPVFLDKIEDKAIADGVQPIPLIDINQNALFGLVFSDDLMNKSVIPFFSEERLAFLEQDLTTNIYKLHHKKKTLGLLSSLPIAGDLRLEDVSMNKWEIFKLISELYDVKIIKNEEDLNQSFDVMMLVHPRQYSENIIEKIKEQKRVLLFLDVADEASLLYSPIGGSFLSSNISDLSDYWGINFYDFGVAADFDNSLMVDETIDYRSNPSFTQDLLQFKITDKELNPNHRITYKLNDILFSSASMVFPKEGADVSFFPLIKTSKNSNLLDVSLVKNKKSPREILKRFSPSNSVTVIAAEFLSNDAKKPFDIIAVADTDFIYDAFWTNKKSFLDKSYLIPLFDNANFVLNALDYLTDNDDLIALRGKKIKRRPLFVVDNMRKINMYKYKLRETDIITAIDGTKNSLKEIVAKKQFEERENFNADELAIIGNIRKEITKLKQQLSDIRLNANIDIDKLEIKVKFFNIYFVAFVIMLVLAVLKLRKTRLSLLFFRGFVFWNKSIRNITISALIIVILAWITIALDNKNSISKYEDMPVLKDFDKKINNISSIVLKTAKETLTFEKKNGRWTIKEYPLYLVYQERIRSFLVTLNNMVYYEKKSDKVGDMKYFGFSSLDNKKSPTINVVLCDDKNNTLESFDIGWYDIDLGRGSKASFIKKPNEFQVWMVEADFYDLSLDPKAWTYSSLWNLRFGRFVKYNDETENKKVMNLVKNLLNTYAIDVVEKIDSDTFATIKIKTEKNDVDLLFYKTDDDKYYVRYEFAPNLAGKHIEFFAEHIKNKFLEISKDDWKRIENDTIRTK